MRCRHCLSYDVPHDAPELVCGRCAALISELADESPAREAGSDDERPASKPKSPGRVRDGRWLAWAAMKRQQTRWFHAYGSERGYPRDLRQWSPHMVERAVQAKIAENAKP